jgi:exportin-T
LQSAIGPLIEGVRSNVVQSVASVENLVTVLQLHHNIIAISNIAKGFPHVANNINLAEPWVEIFKVAAQTITESLKMMSGVQIVREAALNAFKVIVTILGAVVLPLIPPLIECVVGHLSPSDLVEFLPFLSLLLVKYKEDFVPMLDAMLGQVVSRVFVTLEQPMQGTDDELRHSELRRAYFTFLLQVFANNYQSILLSQRESFAL